MNLNEPGGGALAPTREHVETWTYSGERFSDDGLYHEWIDDNAQTHWWKTNITRLGTAIGSRYIVTILTRDDESILVYERGDKQPRFVERLPVTDECVIGWELEAAQARAWDNAKRRAKKDGGVDPIYLLVAPIRNEYLKTRNARGRAAILARVVEAITR